MTLINEDEVRALASFESGGKPVTSCYLNVDGRARVRPLDYERDLARMIRRVSSQVEAEASVATDIDRIVTHVRDGLDRSSVRGLAMFSCAAKGLWKAFSLPVPVYNRISVGHVPALGQLESVIQELRPMGVLLVDRQRARILAFEMGQLVEHTDLLEELPRHYDERGHSERGDHSSHVEELTHQHVRHATRAAFDVFNPRGVGRVTVGGPAEVAAEAEADLHPYLRERLVERLPVGVGASLDEIRSAVLDLEARAERNEEAAAVARLRDALGAGQRGVAGLAPTLQALGERRVEHLLVSEGYEASGWRCPNCSLLATVGRVCAACGGEMDQVHDVVEEAVQEALNQSCHVEMCVENADLDVHGRIGALLRY